MINTPKGVEIYQNKGLIEITRGHNLGRIKHLCMMHLFSYQGYIDSVKKMLKMSYKIPVYMSENHQWIATSNIRSYDNIWINMAHVQSYMRSLDGTRIVFLDKETLWVKNKYEDIKRMVDKLNAIKGYKVKHFQ
jgi:competence transcription factor ComK